VSGQGETGVNMDPKIIVIIATSFVYGLFEVFMNVRQQRRGRVASSDDRGSLWWLYGLITLGYSLSFAIGATKLGRVYPWDTYFAIGAVVFVIGLSIRISAILTLRQSFTYAVARVEGQTIVESGLYRFIRHPGYLGQLLIFTGIALSISNWLSVLLMLVPVTIGYLYRIGVEERFMRAQLGDAYVSYQARTRRLIPLVY
jgi:protein-S-isoprenylcysteine O-methyltransferase Ste14